MMLVSGEAENYMASSFQWTTNKYVHRGTSFKCSEPKRQAPQVSQFKVTKMMENSSPKMVQSLLYNPEKQLCADLAESHLINIFLSSHDEKVNSRIHRKQG